MSATTILSLCGVLFVATIHATSGLLHRGAGARPRWLSAASGLSVAYVFVHLLPELGETQAHWLEERSHRPLPWLESQIYVVALIGVLLALALERTTAGRERPRFWLHVGSFAFYNLLVGGLALRIAGVLPLILAVIAFGAHLLVNDHALARRYGERYRRVGRWVLSAAIVAGWVIAVAWDVPTTASASLLGLLSGGIIINVVKEELPEERVSHLRSLVIGAVAYSALLLGLTYAQHAAAEDPREAVTTRP